MYQHHMLLKIRKPILKRCTTKHRKTKTFCGFPWVETSTAGRVYDLCVYYMTGAPEGSQKVVLCGGLLWFYGEAGNRTCDPWFTRHSAYPLHHGAYRKTKERNDI